MPHRIVQVEPLKTDTLAGALRRVPQGQRGAEGIDDDGLRANAGEDASRQGDWRARGADRAGRGPHLRHGGAVSTGRHLLPRRPALRAGRHGHAAVLQGSAEKARFSRKALPKRARFRPSSPPAPPTPPTASIRFRSSSTTRCSACSASATSCGPPPIRAPGAFCCGGTAGRTTLAGEGSAAPGRPQPPARAGCAESDFLRSGVCVRDCRHHRGRHQADVSGRREHLLLHHVDERAVRDAAHARGMRARASSRGCTGCAPANRPSTSARAHLLGSGAILNEALKAQQMLAGYDVAADVWSVTSYQELYRDGHAVERWNRLHPGEKPRVPYVTQCLGDATGAIVAASDYVKVLPDGIDRWLPRRLRSARYRWLRTQREPGSAPRLLRSGCEVHHGGRAQRARIATVRCTGTWSRRRSRISASTPKSRIRQLLRL